ncbi:MAG: glycoside hydrolase family 18 protein, partial [Chloroflexota bacterium]
NVGKLIDLQQYNYVIRDNAAKRDAFVTSIVAFVKDKGYDGVDVDFEALEVGDRSSYKAFVKELRTALDKEFGARARLLTMAVQGERLSRYGLDDADIKVRDLVDYVSLMGYDYNVGGGNSPADPLGPWQNPNGLSVLQHLDQLANTHKVTPKKIVCLLPFYFRYKLPSGAAGSLSWHDLAPALSATGAAERDAVKNKCVDPSYLEKRISITYQGQTTNVWATDPSCVYLRARAALWGTQDAIPGRSYGGVGAWKVTQDYNGELSGALWQATSGQEFSGGWNHRLCSQ